jgi:hypothetical protein
MWQRFVMSVFACCMTVVFGAVTTVLAAEKAGAPASGPTVPAGQAPAPVAAEGEKKAEAETEKKEEHKGKKHRKAKSKEHEKKSE